MGPDRSFAPDASGDTAEGIDAMAIKHPSRDPLTAWVLAPLLLWSLLAGCTGGKVVSTPEGTASNQDGPRGSSESTAFLPFTPSTGDTTLTFAIIGDYGTGDANAAAVASLAASWDPAFIVTTGDDYYRKAGGTGIGRYKRSTSRFYSKWVSRSYETTRNAFFPSLGNHDYSDAGIGNYRDYFRIPGADFQNSSGNERYYDFEWGPVHFFVLNSNTEERDGTTAESRQARWLRSRLAQTAAPWEIVVDHHPPYSSDRKHGPTRRMRWPFADWGADAVLSGHSHTYERLSRWGIVYFVNGLGGASRYDFGTPVYGSRSRFARRHGAQKVTASQASITFEFYDVRGSLVDSYTLTAAGS